MCQHIEVFTMGRQAPVEQPEERQLRAKGLTTRIPAIRRPEFKSSERIRDAPLLGAEETIMAFQHQIRDSSSMRNATEISNRGIFTGPQFKLTAAIEKG
jgi:hypothetical protein